MQKRHLRVLAGPTAFAWLRAEGLDYGRIQTLAGASGGAKWLVLSQLDRVIAGSLLPRLREPAFLLGSSIGAWRMCAFAQSDPVAAIERFERVYVEQRFEGRTPPDEVTARSRELARAFLGSEADHIVGHPRLRLHIVAVRSRGPAAARGRVAQGLGLLAAASGNLVSRRGLALIFERALFADPRDPAPFRLTPRLRDHQIPLSAENLEDAVLASGSIPMVLDGVSGIRGAPPGVYRDGGVTDYHFADSLSDEHSITLMPHFYPHLIPGWFDKALRHRRRPGPALARTLVLSPSADFVASLPHARIPTRHDFLSFSHRDRLRYWNQVIDRCRVLADELNEIIENHRWGEVVEAL